jgi:hypothetical protein
MGGIMRKEKTGLPGKNLEDGTSRFFDGIAQTKISAEKLIPDDGQKPRDNGDRKGEPAKSTKPSQHRPFR